MNLDTLIEKMKSKFGVNVTVGEARIAYRETVRGNAKAQGRHKRQTGGKGQFGHVRIEVSPGERGSGFVFAGFLPSKAGERAYCRKLARPTKRPSAFSSDCLRIATSGAARKASSTRACVGGKCRASARANPMPLVEPGMKMVLPVIFTGASVPS